MNNLISIGILLTLINNGKTSTKELAEKFEVSPKTISRYILGLINAGAPVLCTQGKNGGIEISPNFVLNNNFLTPAEANVICSLITGSEILGVSKTSKSILDKLNLSLKNQKQQNLTNSVIIDALGWGTKILTSQKLEFLAQSCEQNKVIKFSYIKKSGQIEPRLCEPYALVLKEGVWYLYAYCLTKEDFRLFRCSRILDFAAVNQFFERKAINLNSKPWDNANNFGEQVTLTLEVEKSIYPDLTDWLSNIQLKTVLESKIILTGTATYNEGLITRLLGYKQNLTVISPQNIAQKVKDCCKLISLNYA